MTALEMLAQARKSIDYAWAEIYHAQKTLDSDDARQRDLEDLKKGLTEMGTFILGMIEEG